MAIRELTYEEMRVILNDISENEFEANGSSRAVYSYYCGGKQYAVKLAIGIHGERQTALECERYEDCPDRLAHIYARYGNHMIISEWVSNIWEIVDYYTCGRRGIMEEEEHAKFAENQGYTEQQLNEICDGIEDTLNVMYDLQGDTSDNEQIGINDNGEVVAFDYGYTEGEFKRLAGNLSNYDYTEYLPMFYEKLGIE